MLRNPAYAGKAVFGKTLVVHEQPGLNRVAQLQRRTTPRVVKTVDRPRGKCTEIAVPAIVEAGIFARVQHRLADDKRFAARNATVPPGTGSRALGVTAGWPDADGRSPRAAELGPGRRQPATSPVLLEGDRNNAGIQAAYLEVKR